MDKKIKYVFFMDGLDCRVYISKNSYISLNDFQFDRNFIIFLHGSHGLTPHNMKFINLLLSFNLVVIVPIHSHNCPEYNTTLETIPKYSKSYKCVISARIHLFHILLNYLSRKHKIKNVTVLGSSEGSVVLSASRHKLIKTKIICNYSAEPTYFYDICLFTRPDMHIINIIGSHDEYFGRFSSIMQNFKTPIVGHASYCLIKKKTQSSNVYVILNATHSILFNNYNTVKSILSLHLGSQTKSNFTQISNIVLKNKRIVWFQIQLNRITQISTFGKQIYVL